MYSCCLHNQLFISIGASTSARKHKWGRPRRGICEHMPWLQHEAKCCRSLSQWMILLKYRLQADSVCSAWDRTEAVFLSSITRLHCYACLASACLTRVFVLMRMRLMSPGLYGWRFNPKMTPLSHSSALSGVHTTSHLAKSVNCLGGANYVGVNSTSCSGPATGNCELSISHFFWPKSLQLNQQSSV